MSNPLAHALRVALSYLLLHRSCMRTRRKCHERVLLPIESLMIRAFIFLAVLPAFCVRATSQVRHDVFVRVSESDSLDASYYTPQASPPPSGYPALLFVHGFGLSKDADTADCYYYSAAGYLAVCYSVRGHGNSTGLSSIMSTRERSDLGEVLSWLRSLPSVDTTNIGIVGGSQGGLHGYWAIADGLPVKAISSDVIVPQWASDMLMNGCIRRTMMLLVTTNSVRYAPVRDTLWNLIRKDEYDSLREIFPFQRDVDTSELISRATPILSLLKWQDHYFSAGDGLSFFNEYGGPKKLYAGTQGHFSDQIESERIYQSGLVTRWMNHFLLGQENGILDEPPITYAYSSLPMDTSGYFTWTRTTSSSWPPEGVRPFRLYLARDSTLTLSVPTADAETLLLENLYRDSTYTFDTGYIEGFKGPRFDAALPKNTLVFGSSPLSADLEWVGTPLMHLLIKSDGTTFPLHAQIYEVDSVGGKYFVNRINFTARHWTAGSCEEVSVNGIPHAHRFHEGNRLRIELTNIDRTNRVTLGDFPFVLPTFATTSASIILDPARPSFIELPVIGPPTNVVDGGKNLPGPIVLSQNYPNPFNPTTSLSFVIRHSSLGSGYALRVTLKVFDVLGREVATLVDEPKPPGEYTVQWDARGLPSGVYFYRLAARPRSSGQREVSTFTKKMMIVR